MTVIESLGRFVRGSLAAIGVAVFAVGTLVVFAPGSAESLPVDELITLLGSDYLVVAAVGLAAIGFALFAALFRRLTGVDEATTPVVEEVQSASYPGASFDRSGRAFGIWTPASTRNRLRETAIRTLMRAENCSRSAASRRVDDGTWTDDAAAARLLKGAGSDGALGGALGLGTQKTRTVEAIEAIDAEVTHGTSAREIDRERDTDPVRED